MRTPLELILLIFVLALNITLFSACETKEKVSTTKTPQQNELNITVPAFAMLEIVGSEDEVVKVNGQQTTTQTTRLGLQIKFVDAETSQVIVGSGLGEASTVKTSTILGDISDDVKFNQSTIGITTKKALETASSRVVSRLITKGVFKN